MSVNFVPPNASLNRRSEHPVPVPQYEYPSVYQTPSALLSTQRRKVTRRNTSINSEVKPNRVVLVHATKVYDAEVQIFSFLTLALDRREWLGSLSGYLILGKSAPGTHLI